MTSVKRKCGKHVEHADEHVDIGKQHQYTLESFSFADLSTNLAGTNHRAWTRFGIGGLRANVVKGIDGIKYFWDALHRADDRFGTVAHCIRHSSRNGLTNIPL